MNGLGVDVSFYGIAYPKENLSERYFFVEGNANDFFKAFFKVGFTRLESITSFKLNLNKTVERKIEYAFGIVCTTYDIPTSVVLFEKIRRNNNLSLR